MKSEINFSKKINMDSDFNSSQKRFINYINTIDILGYANFWNPNMDAKDKAKVASKTLNINISKNDNNELILFGTTMEFNDIPFRHIPFKMTSLYYFIIVDSPKFKSLYNFPTKLVGELILRNVPNLKSLKHLWNSEIDLSELKIAKVDYHLYHEFLMIKASLGLKNLTVLAFN